jgi:hypothetical protein
MGAFGELLLLKLIKPADVDGALLAHFRTHIYLADGAAADSTSDLVFTDTDTGTPVGIDAKTFDCDRNKRYFAINDGKHKALRGRCEAYFCALARPFGRFAAIARLVPYADVDPAREAFLEDKWFVGNLLSRGSPSGTCSWTSSSRTTSPTRPICFWLSRFDYTPERTLFEKDLISPNAEAMIWGGL